MTSTGLSKKLKKTNNTAMKKSFILIPVVLALASCGGQKTTIDHQIDKYATVTVPAPDLSGISENGKEVLNLYRFAAYEADKIYWKQYFGDKSLMDSLASPDIKEFAMINYGPWNRIDGKAFVEGYGERPAGVNFYPADITADEFAACGLPDKDSPYTLLRRGDDGSLKTVWYHDVFAAEIEKIASYLTAAADITIKPSVRNYLLKKVEALRTDDYYDADIAWLEMEDSKMDLVLGPNETNDDQFEGIKKSYGALVLLKDEGRSSLLGKYAALVPELQKELPCKEEYKVFNPGLNSDIFVCDALYYGGSYNAGIKEIAINLPYDERVQAERGTRTILLGNVIDAKFNSVINPVAELFLVEDAPNVTRNAFLTNLAFREMAHGLGVKETVTGNVPVEKALGSHALTWEEAKGNVVGAFLAANTFKYPDLELMVSRENVIATFVASLIRSQRFGAGEALGRGNIMVFNYLMKNGALSRNGSAKYVIDYDKTMQCLQDLSSTILRVQAEGDLAAAEEFEKEYAALPEGAVEDMRIMSLESIPVDVKFNFQH